VRRQVAPSAGSDLPFELVHVDLPPGAAVSYPAAAFVFIRQVVLVLDGRLTFVEGETSHTLEHGDSIELGPPVERVFRNNDEQPCTYLVALSRA
jgi:quercetin dioxygenase-like cupin family protein